MQVAIDNAKRKYDIDLIDSIEIIYKDLKESAGLKVQKTDEDGTLLFDKNDEPKLDYLYLPMFWKLTKKDKTKNHTDEQRLEKKKKLKHNVNAHINSALICPMNVLYGIELPRFRSPLPTLPMEHFFVPHDVGSITQKRKSAKVEELIEKFSIKLYEYHVNNEDNSEEDNILLREDFDQMIKEIRSINISNNYVGMISWLINRAFMITAGVKRRDDIISTNTDKNKVILMKTLYEVNPVAFMECFKKSDQLTE